MRFAPVALIASCSALVLLSACSTTKPATDKAAAPAAPVTAAAPTTPAQPSGAAGDGANGNNLAGSQAKSTAPAFDPKSASIFFSFDDSTVNAEAQAVLQQQAQWLQANPQSAMKVEGNCDERGGREYNLALGQRRADATRKALSILTPVDRVETVSYGKERPRAACHDESCWKENRRADFVPATK